MTDQNSVKVTNNQNPTINLEITSFKNNVDVSFTQSIESSLAVHNTSDTAHTNVVNKLETEISLKANSSDLALKADSSTTYTKTQTDTLLNGKLSNSDASVTKKGNNFNGASQLVQLNSCGQLPALDGSLLTALPSTVANTSLSNLNSTAKTLIANKAMPSSSYINLTLGTTGSTYTVPADGYLVLCKNATINGQYVSIFATLSSTRYASASTDALRAWIPVRSGETITYFYTADGTTEAFKFVYAEGSKP